MTRYAVYRSDRSVLAVYPRFSAARDLAIRLNVRSALRDSPYGVGAFLLEWAV